MSYQLGLFAPECVQPIATDQAMGELANALPPWLRLGTSSWTFPGWKGLIYAGSPTADDLTRTGLRAYAAHPLMRTVGIDRSYYGPLSAQDLDGYAAQLPSGFQAVSKIWDALTTFVFPRHPRFGDRAGRRNPMFLDPERTLQILAPYMGLFAPFAGPFVFELPPAPHWEIGDGRAHTAAIERLLPRLPTQFRYAFELRNRELLTPRYLSVLRAHGAAHVINMWTSMPSVGQQLAMPGVITADFVVARLMLPQATRYEELKKAYAPFDRICVEQREMRADVVRLARACESASAELLVIANNKAEGSAPLTIIALARAIADARAKGV